MAPDNRPDVEHGSPADAHPVYHPIRSIATPRARPPPPPVSGPRILVTFAYGADVPVRPPSGTVTFLVTSIQDSLRRWDEAPAEMAAAKGVHDTMVRRSEERRVGKGSRSWLAPPDVRKNPRGTTGT